MLPRGHGMHLRVKPEDGDAGASAITSAGDWRQRPAASFPSIPERQRSLYPRAQTSVSSSSRPSLFVIPGRSRSAAKAQILGSMPEHGGSARRSRFSTASPTMSVPAWILGSSPRMTMRGGLRQSQAPAIGGSAPRRRPLHPRGNAPSIPERKRPSLRHPAPLSSSSQGGAEAQRRRRPWDPCLNMKAARGGSEC